jgi:hypothetical protein
VSLYSVVSRGVAGRVGQRSGVTAASEDRAGARIPGVRLPGASMLVLEACLALGAIATAILLGVGR